MDSSPVFVSYHPADKEFAKQLVDDLRTNGFATYLQDELEDIHQCERLVLVMSTIAVEEESWKKTYQAFATQGKLICSARIDGVNLPSVLDELEWVDFSLSYDSGVNGIKVSLNTEMSQPPPLLSDVRLDTASSSQQMFVGVGVAILLLIIGIAVIFFLLPSL